MIERFKRLIRSRTEIITVSIGAIPALIDWYQIIEHVLQWAPVIVLVLLAMVVMLAINHFYVRRQAKQTETARADGQVKQSNPPPVPDLAAGDPIAPQTSPGTSEVAQVAPSPVPPQSGDGRKSGFLMPLFKYLSLGAMAMILSSFLYLKGKNIHYVLVRNDLTLEEGNALMKRLNSEFSDRNETGYTARLKRKSTKDLERNYFVCINGGYLSRKEASKVYEEVRRLLPKERHMELKESWASPVRKLQYLGEHATRNFYFFLKEEE